MLVVVIVGVLAAGVSLIVTRDRESVQINHQVTQLQNTIRAVQARAMISQRFYGLTLFDGGWRVVVIKPDAAFLTWGVNLPAQAANTNTPAQVSSAAVDIDAEKKRPWVLVDKKSEHLLPETLEMELYLEGSESSMLADEPSAPPQVVFSGQGEVTPFVVLFRGVTQEAESLVEVSADGRVLDIGVSDFL